MSKFKDWLKKNAVNFIAVFVIISSVYIILKPKTYHIDVSLVYQNATSGLNPNGSKYNPYLMLSDNVLEPVEEELGVDLKDKVWLRPSNYNRGKTISTEYRLNCKGLKNCPVVLEKITESYSNYFEKHFTINRDILTYNDLDEDYDYVIVSEYLEKEAEKLTSFVNKRVKENSSWYTDDEAVGNFQNLLEYGKNIIDVDIHNLKTYLTENGISKNPEELSGIIDYRNRLLSLDKAKYDAQYLNRRQAITLYDPTLFPTISVPSVRGGEYYVTTTKTGLDYIYDAAALFSESSYSLQRSISDNKLITRNMKVSSSDEQAEEMIQNIIEKLKSYAELIESVDETFVEETKTKYLEFSEVSR